MFQNNSNFHTKLTQVTPFSKVLYLQIRYYHASSYMHICIVHCSALHELAFSCIDYEVAVIWSEYCDTVDL